MRKIITILFVGCILHFSDGHEEKYEWCQNIKIRETIRVNNQKNGYESSSDFVIPIRLLDRIEFK